MKSLKEIKQILVCFKKREHTSQWLQRELGIKSKHNSDIIIFEIWITSVMDDFKILNFNTAYAARYLQKITN